MTRASGCCTCGTPRRPSWRRSGERPLGDFPAGALTTDGLIYRLILIGEAAAHVPPEDRAHYPTIPWQSVIGLRNRMIHGYDTVNLDRVWQIIHEELPPLLAALRDIVGNDPPKT